MCLTYRALEGGDHPLHRVRRSSWRRTRSASTVCARAIRTAIVASSAHGMDAEKVAKFEAGIRAQMRADRPLEREGTAADVAEAVLFFAGDRLALRHRHRAAGRRRHRGGQAEPEED